MLWSARNYKKCTLLNNLRITNQEGNIETRQTTPFFSSTFFTQTVCKIHFWIWKYSKFIFMWSPLWSILVCKIPQSFAESYRFRQLITLRSLNIYIIVCPPARAKYPFFRPQLMDFRWCYIIIGSFDWKIDIFPQNFVRGLLHP